MKNQPETWRRALEGKRLIFTVTTGRSGTEHLARLLDAFPGVRARHEPRPTFSNVFRAVLHHPPAAREFWVRQRLPRIAAERNPIYVETSHLIGKGFLDALVDLGVRFELIHLWRDPRSVASSLCKLGTVPGRSLGGSKYYLDPSDPALLPVTAARVSTWPDYALAYWYALEIDARAAAWRLRSQDLGQPFHRVELESLRSAQGTLELGRELGLPVPGPLGRARIRHRTRVRTNAKSHKKHGPLPPSHELESIESEVRDAVGHPEPAGTTPPTRD